MQFNEISRIASIRLFYAVAIGIYTFFVPLLLQDRGLSAADIGFLIGISSSVAIFSSLPAGVLSDRLTPKKLAIGAALLLGIFYLALGNIGSLLLLLPAFVIGGLGDNLFNVSMDSNVYKLLKHEKDKGHNLGLVQFARFVGSASGAYFGGVLLSHFGFTDVFTGMAVSMLCLAAIMTRMKDLGAFRINLEDYTSELKRPGAMLLMVAFFLLAFHFGSELVALSLYANTVIGLNETEIGLLFGITVAFYGFSAFVAGKSFDIKKRYKAIFIGGLLLSALGNVLYAYSWDFNTALASRLIHEFGDGFAIMFAGFAVAKMFPESKLGGSAGALTLASGIGTAIGAFASGVIADYASLQAVFILAATLTLLGLLLVIFAKKYEGTLFKTN